MSVRSHRHSKGGSQIIGEIAGLFLLQPDLKLFALVVEVAVQRHPWFGLPFEEGVVQLLVVDVDLAQLGADLERENIPSVTNRIEDY